MYHKKKKKRQMTNCKTYSFLFLLKYSIRLIAIIFYRIDSGWNRGGGRTRIDECQRLCRGRSHTHTVKYNNQMQMRPISKVLYLKSKEFQDRKKYMGIEQNMLESCDCFMDVLLQEIVCCLNKPQYNKKIEIIKKMSHQEKTKLFLSILVQELVTSKLDLP